MLLKALSSVLLACSDQGPEPPVVGATVWRAKMDLPVSWGRTPVLVGDLFVFPRGPGIRALHVADGTEVWRSEPLIEKAVGPHIYNLAVHDSTIYAAHDYELVAFSTTSGVVRWRFTAPAPDTGAFLSETWVDHESVFTATRGHVYALDPSTHAIQWHRDLALDWHGRAIVQGFAVSGDTLFVTVSGYRTADTFTPVAIVLALDRHSGAERWRWQTDVTPTVTNGPPILDGASVIALDFYGRQVYALDRATGRLRWQFETAVGWMGAFDAIVRDGTVYIASGDKYVYALDTQTGALRWKSTTRSSNTRLSFCGRNLVVDILGFTIMDAATGHVLFSGGNNSDYDYTLSGFAVRDGIAYVTGSEYAEAFRCDR